MSYKNISEWTNDDCFSALPSSLPATGVELTHFQNLGVMGDAFINTPTLVVNLSSFTPHPWRTDYRNPLSSWGVGRSYICNMWQASPPNWIRKLLQRLWGKSSGFHFLKSRVLGTRGEGFTRTWWQVCELWEHEFCMNNSLLLLLQGIRFAVSHPLLWGGEEVSRGSLWVRV